MTGPLAGLAIAVTRPAGQAEGLCQLIEAAGGEAVRAPALAIAPVSDAAVRPALAGIQPGDWAVFISPNAVQYAWPALDASGRARQLRYAAIGPGTAEALRRRGIVDVLLPEGAYDSEHLLMQPVWQDLAGQRVWLLRGDGGRELLAETLAARGARVEKISCYTRRPAPVAAILLPRWRAGTLQAVTLTSSEALRGLVGAVGEEGHGYLAHTPVFAPHARIVETARACGLQAVFQTAAADVGLVQGMIDWRLGRRAPAR